jgi:prephenate dehydratase
MPPTADEDPAAAPRVAYLGPRGTFTEQALLTQPDLAAGEPLPCASMADALFAVQEGAADLAVVPIENAIEGTVNATIDTLAFDVDLLIQRELVLPVQLNLLVRPGADLTEVRRVVSIPVAAAQCRAWLRQHLPGAELVTAGSTAEAARTAAAADDPTVAAIANVRAAEVYGLTATATDIESHPENRTRFVVVAPSGVPAPTGHDKSSLVVYQRADRPGSLLAILQEFAARSINLTLLLSRPTKTSLGEYCFVIDLEGHVADEVVADCLRTLRATQADVKFLGSYPAAGEAAPAARAAVDEALAGADAWLASLRAQVRTAVRGS